MQNYYHIRKRPIGIGVTRRGLGSANKPPAAQHPSCQNMRARTEKRRKGVFFADRRVWSSTAPNVPVVFEKAGDAYGISTRVTFVDFVSWNFVWDENISAILKVARINLAQCFIGEWFCRLSTLLQISPPPAFLGSNTRYN